MTLPKIQVLIVDDHAIVRTGLRLLIGGQTDMSVVGEAGSTQEGIELAEGLGPDIALVDLSLPGEGGIEVIRHLRRTRPRVRTVALTMHDEVAYLHSALSAGCSGYVVKRAADSELLAAIRAEDLRSLAIIYDKTPGELTDQLIEWGVLPPEARPVG